MTRTIRSFVAALAATAVVAFAFASASASAQAPNAHVGTPENMSKVELPRNTVNMTRTPSPSKFAPRPTCRQSQQPWPTRRAR